MFFQNFTVFFIDFFPQNDCPVQRPKKNGCWCKFPYTATPISTFMCLWAICIFPGSVYIFPPAEQADPSWGYMIRSDTWMWKLGLRPRYSFSGNICFKFSAFCLCSVVLGIELIMKRQSHCYIIWLGIFKDFITLKHSLNVEVDLRSLLGSVSRDVHSCTHWLRPRNFPPRPAFGIVYEGAIVQQR